MLFMLTFGASTLTIAQTCMLAKLRATWQGTLAANNMRRARPASVSPGALSLFGS